MSILPAEHSLLLLFCHKGGEVHLSHLSTELARVRLEVLVEYIVADDFPLVVLLDKRPIYSLRIQY
jgi:hypothetical protein